MVWHAFLVLNTEQRDDELMFTDLVCLPTANPPVPTYDLHLFLQSAPIKQGKDIALLTTNKTQGSLGLFFSLP